MSSQRGFVIHVGQYAPQKVIIGFPGKDGLPQGETFETYKQVGVHQLINRTRVWARRVQSDGTLPKVASTNEEQPLEVTDQRYRGRLEFLKWGENKTGAQAIEIRYLPQSSSLDYEFQKNVQKIETIVEDGTDYIDLSPGENKFDPKTQALLIEMLKVHAQNRDSVSKNPDPRIKGYMYFVVTDENVDKVYVSKKEQSLDAGILIKQWSAKDGQLLNLLEIFTGYKVDFGDVNHLSVPTDVYRALLTYSEVNPQDLLANIHRYKEELLKDFEFAKSFNALDTTKDGFIGLMINGKPNIIWQDLEGKGNKMIDYVVDNFADNKIYEATKNFKSLLTKLVK